MILLTLTACVSPFTGKNQQSADEEEERTECSPTVQLSTTELLFDGVRVINGETAHGEVSLLNMGNCSFEIESIQIENNDHHAFNAQIVDANVWPGEEGTIRVRYTPGYRERLSVTLSITVSGVEEPLTVSIEGNAIAPEVRFSNVVSFGVLDEGCRVQRDIGFTNVGDDTLTIRGFQLYDSPNIEIMGAPTDLVIEHRQSASVTMEFWPRRPLSSIADLELGTSDPLNPEIVLEMEVEITEPRTEPASFILDRAPVIRDRLRIARG